MQLLLQLRDLRGEFRIGTRQRLVALFHDLPGPNFCNEFDERHTLSKLN
mgnify:CR=1 FL=1